MNYLNVILKVFLGVCIIAASAQLTFHLPLSTANIPITGQTLGVILVTYFSQKYFGVATVTLYLILGAIGIPIFADGAFGWDILYGGSGGFLIGFLAASILIYFFKSKFDAQKLTTILHINVWATVVIVAFGVLRLSLLYGAGKALEYGFYPFWQGAVIKILVGAAVMFTYQKIFSKRKMPIKGEQ